MSFRDNLIEVAIITSFIYHSYTQFAIHQSICYYLAADIQDADITRVLDEQICSLLRGGIAERGGVRVGHRIIEINSQSVVAVPHEKIVNMLASSVGEVTRRIFPAHISCKQWPKKSFRF